VPGAHREQIVKLCGIANQVNALRCSVGERGLCCDRAPTRRAIAQFPPMAKPDENPEHQSIAKNRRARHDYSILDTYEAGLVLTGSEVKSLRDGKANLSDAYGIVRNGELFLLNLHISPYERASYNNHEPTRTRKLLLHKREIRRLIGAVERQGLTLVPLELYFKRGVAKVAMALGKGKKQHDKRDAEKQRDADREIARVVRTR
jgi:SsrA-binding protein